MLAVFFSIPFAAVSQRRVTGTLIEHRNFASKFVMPRQVDVWLPPRYHSAPAQRYAVLYAHDGQNLFDPYTAFIKVDWGLDETLTQLIAEDKVQEVIVVGIWNTPKRRQEYMPEKAAATFLGEPVQSDNYLRFLVEELKPFIDSTYRTRPEQSHTFIMGSSMGGLISLYAICEYPHIFGGAACLSTHFPAADGAVIEYMKSHLPDPATHKIYFDYGTETLDAQYEPYQQRADAVMRQRGFIEGKNWITRKFPGDEHSERAWRKRVHIPLLFLLGK